MCTSAETDREDELKPGKKRVQGSSVSIQKLYRESFLKKASGNNSEPKEFFPT